MGGGARKTAVSPPPPPRKRFAPPLQAKARPPLVLLRPRVWSRLVLSVAVNVPRGGGGGLSCGWVGGWVRVSVNTGKSPLPGVGGAVSVQFPCGLLGHGTGHRTVGAYTSVFLPAVNGGCSSLTRSGQSPIHCYFFRFGELALVVPAMGMPMGGVWICFAVCRPGEICNLRTVCHNAATLSQI